MDDAPLLKLEPCQERKSLIIKDILHWHTSCFVKNSDTSFVLDKKRKGLRIKRLGGIVKVLSEEIGKNYRKIIRQLVSTH